MRETVVGGSTGPGLSGGQVVYFGLKFDVLLHLTSF